MKEYRSALDWLNNLASNVMFFGLELEVLRIDNSKPSRRAARIMTYYLQSITIEEVADSHEVKQRIIEWSIDIVRKFKQSFTPRIQRLSI